MLFHLSWDNRPGSRGNLGEKLFWTGGLGGTSVNRALYLIIMMLVTLHSQLSDMVVVLVTTLYTVEKVLDWGTKVRVGMICSKVISVIPGTWEMNNQRPDMETSDQSEAEITYRVIIFRVGEHQPRLTQYCAPELTNRHNLRICQGNHITLF